MLLGLVVSITTLLLIQGQSPLSCDFERNNLCQYMNYKDSTVLWSVRKALNVSGGPAIDRTLQTGNGHYAYLELPESSENVYTDLEIPDINVSTHGCLRFWYYVSNDKSAYFDVWEWVGQQYYKLLYMFPLGSGLSNMWIQDSAPLSPTANSTIMFTGQISDYMNKSALHFVALDDIKFTPGSCTRVQTDPSTKTLGAT